MTQLLLIAQILLLSFILYALAGCQSLSGLYSWQNGNSEGTVTIKKIPDDQQTESDTYIIEGLAIPDTTKIH